MELYGVVPPKLPCLAGAGIDSHRQPSPTHLRFSGEKVRSDLGRSRFPFSAKPKKGFGFWENGYHRGVPRCGVKMEKGLEAMTMKKKLKLLKELLSEKFSVFCKPVSGCDGVGLVSQVQERMVSEAAEILIKQLQQVSVNDKEPKKEKKQETPKPNPTMLNHSSSSSSSSSSSDTKNEEPPISIVDESRPKKRIEVCMGKKCKRAGGGALLEELDKAVGIEGAVVESKCMGKCKNGPNVRLVSESQTKKVCVGVGLEDVPLIVDEYNNGDMGLEEKSPC